MKKILLVALMAALLLTGCGADGAAEPPKAEVTYNGQTVTALRGVTSWSYKQGGEWETLEQESELPFSADGTLPIFSYGERLTVELSFEETPTKVTVLAYATEHQGDYANPSVYEELTVKDNTVTLPDDFGYILEIYATWSDLSGANGSAYYYVQIAD